MMLIKINVIYSLIQLDIMHTALVLWITCLSYSIDRYNVLLRFIPPCFDFESTQWNISPESLIIQRY
jgi:hypothetical protein